MSGRITDVEREAIVERADIAEVVGRSVELRPRGVGRYLVGCCPFHGGSSENFQVDVEKKYYYCFGCGEHGNVINFVMKTQGLAFPEAARQLAGEVGIALECDAPRAKSRADVVRTLADGVERVSLVVPAGLVAGSGGVALNGKGTPCPNRSGKGRHWWVEAPRGTSVTTPRGEVDLSGCTASVPAVFVSALDGRRSAELYLPADFMLTFRRPEAFDEEGRPVSWSRTCRIPASEAARAFANAPAPIIPPHTPVSTAQTARRAAQTRKAQPCDGSAPRRRL